MIEAVGLTVSRLMRVRFGPVALPGHVKRGMMREMEEEQVQELLAFAGMNEPAAGGEAGAEGEDDALENIGNRIEDHREPREREIDDDIGNKVHHARGRAAAPEPDGNRGTYDPNAVEERASKPGPRRPHGHKPFFKQEARPGPGQRAAPGTAARRSPGQARTSASASNRQRKHGQGKRRTGRARAAAGHGAQGHARGGPGAAGGAGTGKGKPGRNRRNKNRNRNRGAQEARGEQQPANNGNRDPH